MRRRQTTARNVVPVDHLLYEDDARRFEHADLGALEERELWADRVLVEHALARLIFCRVRPRHLDRDQTDQAWLSARSCRLRDELARRRAARGRHAA